ncbi:tRNA uridine-5-carboxymethylaminomethyl(34) synthesis enzyme MnmG [Marinivivus vitaminiproducens]|uniref:tRNA uridine-5-carboxymethylaminomethyl(34) synthesis enzyme MnmG n=1 Tax=Marinivivus vitaminiproducens TaxID=3035935 RepID=UPI0027A1EBE3|nr:tRNA uridine-5-carboxymethylaminomethyl(34) synthesis enzyme MnmG [Geminicoccaceae bacterium SCSIO 64248]
MKRFDVIVIGAGHAGCEAAAAAARVGADTLLLTQRLDRIGTLSCNPAIGGLGRGHLVREVDALDGIMARAIDRAGIQFRVLNRSAGPAVQGPRAQADRRLYARAVQALLAEQDKLTVEEATVEDIEQDDAGRVSGVLTGDGRRWMAGAVVLTTGTFLRGVIHLGEERWPAGRMGDASSTRLAERLAAAGLPMARLKTGTPPRLDGRTIDWAGLEIQPGDDPPVPMSFLTTAITTPQVDCRLTYTNAAAHDLVRAHLGRTAMYAGRIDGTGVRYCPSIEDKVVRFADRARHQIFLEPEGLGDPTIYPNGISTSLPRDVQVDLVRLLPGLERVEVLQPGYAIEYDYVDPRSLSAGLACRRIAGLFRAGQINGTTGYEEAAGQGVVAGINAARFAGGQPPWLPSRTDGLIGVMLDDLTVQGVTEPYRMFTSRAEYRLSLRADNADLRLTPTGVGLGVVGAERARTTATKRECLEAARAVLASLAVSPQEAARHGIAVKSDGRMRSGHDLLALPGMTLARVVPLVPELDDLRADVTEQLEIEARYAVYLRRQAAEVSAIKREEQLTLPVGLDYGALGGLSRELRDRLERTRPASLAAAARLPGMTPAAMTVLYRYATRAA